MYTNYDKKALKTLTERERSYFNKMAAQSGVLFITSRPGEAKSSLSRSIAKKLNMQYMDIRLSMVDETDVGLFPNIESVEIDGVKMKVLGHAVPKWAMKANERPTIIHFEELNRATLSVRNAALQLLLEREIGTEFKFNNNVLMLASGNLGEEDGTDVEEFDAALNNRLIHVPHSLTAPEWIESYADENVNKFIVAFIKSAPEWIYKVEGSKNDENAVPKTYATPRSWTFLSDFIKSSLGDDENDIQAVKKLVDVEAHYYVGGVAKSKLSRYLEESMNLTIYDVINNYNKVETILKKSNRDRRSELLQNLKELDLAKEVKSDKNIKNLDKFFDLLDEDELAAYLTSLIDSLGDDQLSKAPYSTILKMPKYKDLLIKISEMS